MLKKKTDHYIYHLKRLIPGSAIGLTGWYAAVPDKGYKGHAFKIQFLTSKVTDGQLVYVMIEKEVKDWNKAEAFRKQVNQFAGGGFFTLGYFKMCEEGEI